MVKEQIKSRTVKDAIAKLKYSPVFAEEIFVVTLYGTRQEVKQLFEMLKTSDDQTATDAISDLIKQVKRRRFPGNRPE